MASPRDVGVLLLRVCVGFLTLSAVCSGDQSNSSSSNIDLTEFLHHARNNGLINSTTINQLLQLAANMTGSSAQLSLKLPSQEAYGEKGGLESPPEEKNGETNFFLKVYNRLTLLNILYFGGALLVMGSYTLFMTLAYEKCSYSGLSCIMLAQVLGSGVAGVVMWWNNNELQFVGGL